MSLKDYDIIIDIVESNIMLSKNDISTKVSVMLGLSERPASEFFKNINPEGMTVKQYILDRKNLKALGDCASGMTKESVCERYSLDSSNLFNSMRALFPGKKIDDLRKEGFTCPAPITLQEIIENEGIYMKEEHRMDDNQQLYISEIQRLIDENTQLRTNLTAEKKASINRLDRLVDENIQLKTDLTEEKNRIDRISKGDEISDFMYMRFLEIEDKRIIYGFSVQEILRLYKESLKGKYTLDELCNRAQDSYFFELERLKDKEMPLFHPEDEMDLGETWSYFFGEDDPADGPEDPYAPTDEEKYLDQLLFEEEYEQEEAYCDDDLTEEQEKEIDLIMEQVRNKHANNEGKEESSGKVTETDLSIDEDLPF